MWNSSLLAAVSFLNPLTPDQVELFYAPSRELRSVAKHEYPEIESGWSVHTRRYAYAENEIMFLDGEGLKALSFNGQTRTVFSLKDLPADLGLLDGAFDFMRLADSSLALLLTRYRTTSDPPNAFPQDRALLFHLSGDGKILGHRQISIPCNLCNSGAQNPGLVLKLVPMGGAKLLIHENPAADMIRSATAFVVDLSDQRDPLPLKHDLRNPLAFRFVPAEGGRVLLLWGDQSESGYVESYWFALYDGEGQQIWKRDFGALGISRKDDVLVEPQWSAKTKLRFWTGDYALYELAVGPQAPSGASLVSRVMRQNVGDPYWLGGDHYAFYAFGSIYDGERVQFARVSSGSVELGEEVISHWSKSWRRSRWEAPSFAFPGFLALFQRDLKSDGSVDSETTRLQLYGPDGKLDLVHSFEGDEVGFMEAHADLVLAQLSNRRKSRLELFKVVRKP